MSLAQFTAVFISEPGPLPGTELGAQGIPASQEASLSVSRSQDLELHRFTV